MSTPGTHQPVFGPGALGVLVVLFGLLAFAESANEFLKQLVIAPDSSAVLGISPDCRADELEEENLSVLECELLVSNVQIQLASSPAWFRPAQLLLAGAASLLALCSLAVGFALVNRRFGTLIPGGICLALLLAIDTSRLVTVALTGPLLRALYLWPALIWLFVHLCLFLGVWKIAREARHD